MRDILTGRGVGSCTNSCHTNEEDKCELIRGESGCNTPVAIVRVLESTMLNDSRVRHTISRTRPFQVKTSCGFR
jgi:hypothetical protein